MPCPESMPRQRPGPAHRADHSPDGEVQQRLASGLIVFGGDDVHGQASEGERLLLGLRHDLRGPGEGHIASLLMRLADLVGLKLCLAFRVYSTQAGCAASTARWNRRRTCRACLASFPPLRLRTAA